MWRWQALSGHRNSKVTEEKKVLRIYKRWNSQIQLQGTKMAYDVYFPAKEEHWGRRDGLRSKAFAKQT